jgi:hypothetical protein
MILLAEVPSTQLKVNLECPNRSGVKPYSRKIFVIARGKVLVRDSGGKSLKATAKPPAKHTTITKY